MESAPTEKPSTPTLGLVGDLPVGEDSTDNRQQYITRLPSSSLLAQPLTAEPNSEAPQYGSVDLITLKIKPEKENEVVHLLSAQTSSLPKNISWFVAKSTEEDAAWMVLETQISAPHKQIYSSPSATTLESSKVTDQQSCHSDVKIIRQSSRFIEAFRSSSPDGANPLGDFLSAASPFTSCPPEMSRSRMIIAPLSSHRQIQSSATHLPRKFQSYFAIVLETAKSKIGQARIFIESCTTFEATLSIKVKAETKLVTIEVHQDLEPSANGRLFNIVYYFVNEDAAKEFRQTDLWKSWRRSVSSLLEGPPRLQFFQGLLDSRLELQSYARVYEKSEAPTDDTLPVAPVTSFESLSPASIVSHVRGTLTRRQTAQSAEFHVVEPLSKPLDGTGVVSLDLRLESFTDNLRERYSKYLNKRTGVLKIPIDGKIDLNSFQIFKTVHQHFGIYRGDGSWIIRDWIPNVNEVYLMGDFNGWDRTTFPLSKEPPELYGSDVWSIVLKDHNDGSQQLQHKMKYKFHITTFDGQEIDRIPPSASLVWKCQDGTGVYDAVVWSPSESERYLFKHVSPNPPISLKIYEAYVGFSSHQSRFGTYTEFRNVVLPRIHRLGYNSIILTGVPQHSLVSVGWHVSNFRASTSEFGTPEELKALIDAAHGLGIYVILSVVQSHASTCTASGLNEIDGTEGGFFRTGPSGKHPQWNVRLFDYSKPEVCRFLMSQLGHFMDEYNVDGFRFEGLTSMLYHHHGIGRDFREVGDLGRYFSFESDDEAATYLMLVNEFIHSISSNRSITIGTDRSHMPILAHPVANGGIGFNYRMAPHIANEWVRQLCHSDDSKMVMSAIVNALELRSPLEKTVAASEALENSLRSRRPLKIAMFAWETLHTHAVGGVAPHVTELAAGLARLGHEVHIFARATGSVSHHSVHYGVHYHECPFQLNRDFVGEVQHMCNSFISNMNATEQFMGQMFDICHSHDWLAVKAIVQAKQQGHTCIQTMHSTEFGRCGNNVYGGESKRISDIEREGCHVCDRIICVSGVLANEVSHLFGVHRQKIEAIYNGINACNFDGFEDAAPIKARYGIPPMDPVFLFVGRMTIQKGPDLLIEAIPFILRFRSDVKFVIVGDGHMKQGLMSRADQLGVGYACRFLGAKSGGELISLFKACDAVVVPSRNEPFGIVVLESWSAYKPVVATTCGGPRDFVTPNTDGYLVDPNASSIAWGCCEILKNFEHARWMGERGRVKAAFSFSWDRIAKNTEAIYYEQLNKHDSPDSEGDLGGCSLAFRLMGPAMYEHMGVFDQNDAVNRGMALHKMIRLMTIGLGGECYLNFMGNEFGHPEFIDVPRAGNNFSYHHSNRRFDLTDDKLLKYKHLEFFDACMIRLESYCKWLASSNQFVTVKNELDKVIAFERGPCLFVFNLHPHQSFEGYQIGHSLGPDLRILFDTDDIRFGGFNRLAAGHENPFPTLESFNNRNHSIKLYIPSRTAMVLIPSSFNTSELESDPIFSIKNVDEFILKLSSNITENF